MSDYAWGPPPVTGIIRTMPEDFTVEEELGFEPEGEGEHLWLAVEKRAANTQFVAGALSRLAGIPVRAVGYAGLKDRNALARQTFSLYLGNAPDPDWSAWDIEGARILGAARGAKKLKRGGLAGNRFRLIVRDTKGDRDALQGRLETVRDHGVPNGFGEQRFGRGNIARAHRLFRGELRRKPAKGKRAFYLSAARSLIFNRLLAERIGNGTWNRLIPGDCAMLDGTRSFFAADPGDPDQVRRCAGLDIHPTGPLAGEGEPPVTADALALEREIEAEQAELLEGLKRFRLGHQRRALRMRVRDLEWRFLARDELELCFRLPAGSYATSVLRELAGYTVAGPADEDKIS